MTNPLYPAPPSDYLYYHLFDTATFSFYLVVSDEFHYIDRVGKKGVLGWISMDNKNKPDYKNFKTNYDKAIELANKLLNLL